MAKAALDARRTLSSRDAPSQIERNASPHIEIQLPPAISISANIASKHEERYLAILSRLPRLLGEPVKQRSITAIAPSGCRKFSI
jgi:hypothetical protein